MYDDTVYYHLTREGAYVPASLKVLNTNVASKILHGISVWIKALNKTAFLRKILGLPRYIVYASLCLEMGQLLIETRAWLIANSL